ncbi:hypothetical protein [Streptococcus pneumoniae]|uniref:hypothetical protein n=1 Tax=Streptococcus pneumoniae TaxID=1313 RepID=UPI001E62FBE4|nr:hypothetical protein [Streptococcus pneumoniae]
MKIKKQTRKLATGCSNTVLRLWIRLTKSAQNTVDGTDEVSSKHCFEVVDRTDEVSNRTTVRRS